MRINYQGLLNLCLLLCLGRRGREGRKENWTEGMREKRRRSERVGGKEGGGRKEKGGRKGGGEFL